MELYCSICGTKMRGKEVSILHGYNRTNGKPESFKLVEFICPKYSFLFCNHDNILVTKDELERVKSGEKNTVMCISNINN